jgi:hypothetical protein
MPSLKSVELSHLARTQDVKPVTIVPRLRNFSYIPSPLVFPGLYTDLSLRPGWAASEGLPARSWSMDTQVPGFSTDPYSFGFRHRQCQEPGQLSQVSYVKCLGTVHAWAYVNKLLAIGHAGG